MSVKSCTDVLSKVEEIAGLAGYKVSRHPSGGLLVVAFDMGRGRTQNVFIAPCGTTPDGKNVVTISSPCMAVKKGLFKGIGRAQALDLLRRNAMLTFGHFAIASAGDCEGVMVCATQIVETMEIEEFEALVNTVAIVADEYEREHGQDRF
ncbi:MAG: hypothetical protein KJZ54_03175 [Phycisphaerales bacterium]|nr:hypothetical protein [Phycisphaerales bacterium]